MARSGLQLVSNYTQKNGLGPHATIYQTTSTEMSACSIIAELLENVEHCEGELEQADTGYYLRVVKAYSNFDFCSIFALPFVL